jgi:hypothetical protein
MYTTANHQLVLIVVTVHIADGHVGVDADEIGMERTGYV